VADGVEIAGIEQTVARGVENCRAALIFHLQSEHAKNRVGFELLITGDRDGGNRQNGRRTDTYARSLRGDSCAPHQPHSGGSQQTSPRHLLPFYRDGRNDWSASSSES